MNDLSSSLARKTNENKPITQSEVLYFQMLRNIGIPHFPYQNLWDQIIYRIDSPRDFENFYLIQSLNQPDKQQLFVTLLSKSIQHGNIPFIKFLLERLDKITDADWATIYIRSWFSAFTNGINPQASFIKSMILLFGKYNSLNQKEKTELFEKEYAHRKSIQAAPNVDAVPRENLSRKEKRLANLNKGMDFLRTYFLSENSTKSVG